MYIISNHNGLRILNKQAESLFIKQYKQSPTEYQAKNNSEYSINDLQDIYIVSVDGKERESIDIGDGKFSVNILGIYSPRKDQKASLYYCDPVAFVDIRDETNERIELLYKDDECFPLSFNTWYDDWIEEYDIGVTPTKKQLLETIKIIIKGYCQDPDLELDVNENNVIILQGL